MSSTQKSAFKPTKRLLATVASAAMIFALLPAGIALGESPSNVCPAPGGNETFPDVEDGVHADNIECVAGYDIANGYADGTYRPGVDITRAQMATFVANLIEAATGEELSTGTADHFADDDDSPHQENINKLAENDVVTGRGGDQYDPALPVNRGSMATFVRNALDYVDNGEVDESYPPSTTNDHFTDDGQSPHEENINVLAEAGIVEGQDSSTEYNPGNNVFRGQMASFVMESASQLETDDMFAANDPEITTNQSFAVTPSDAAENEVSSGGGNEGARQYSVSGLDDSTTYDIALFDSGNVTIDENGVVTFEDDPDNDQADWTANNDIATGAVITVVNGSTNPDNPDDNHVETSPVNGTISFTVNSEAPDSIEPVIWVDATGGTANIVDLNDDDTPSEDFGVGGEKTWIPAEASFADPIGDETIESFDTDADRIVTTDNTYYYDTNDRFFVDDDGSCNAADEVVYSTFETALTEGDELLAAGSYNPTPELESTFCLNDISPAVPTGVNATAADSDVTVTWNAAAGADSYNVYRQDDPNGDSNCADAVAADWELRGNTTTTSFTDANVADDVWCYTVTSVSDDEESDFATPDAVTTPTPDNTAPTSQDAELTTDSGFADLADSGDVWQIDFDENIVVASNAQLLVVGDTTGTDTVTNGENAVFTVDGDVLTVTLSQPLTDSNGDVLDYPVEITNRSGITDASGNGWNLAGSADVVVDDEAAPAVAGVADDADTDTLTITWSEIIDVIGTADQVTVYSSTNGSCTTLVSTGNAVGDDDGDAVETVDLGTALTDGTTYDMQVTASHVEDFLGNDNATQCFTFTK